MGGGIHRGRSDSEWSQVLELRILGQSKKRGLRTTFDDPKLGSENSWRRSCTVARHIDEFKRLWIVGDGGEGAGSSERVVICDLLIFSIKPELAF